MLGFLMQMANISSESKVLMVENTRGFIPGVMIEKQIKYGLKVEFCTRSLKHVTDILVEMDHPSESHSRIGCINSNLLMDDCKDPLQ